MRLRSWWRRRTINRGRLPLSMPREQRIALEADRIRKESGIAAISALAAAEAIELGREHGLRFDRIEYDPERMRWNAIYETGPVRRPMWVVLPLEHATEATQRGLAPLN